MEKENSSLLQEQENLNVELPARFNPNDTVALPRLLTVMEVADYLKLSRMQIFRLVSSGRLRAIKFGHTKQAGVRFLLSELIEDLQKMRVSTNERGQQNE